MSHLSALLIYHVFAPRTAIIHDTRMASYRYTEYLRKEARESGCSVKGVYEALCSPLKRNIFLVSVRRGKRVEGKRSDKSKKVPSPDVLGISLVRCCPYHINHPWYHIYNFYNNKICNIRAHFADAHRFGWADATLSKRMYTSKYICGLIYNNMYLFIIYFDTHFDNEIRVWNVANVANFHFY